VCVPLCEPVVLIAAPPGVAENRKELRASIDVLWLAKSPATWLAGSGSVGLFVWNVT
jgi:hypothetical protein